jgi:hypothetical protein
MEVLVGDDTLNSAEIKIAGCIRSSQYKTAVENVEGLVLHRTHIEIIDSNNVKEVEVVFKPVRILVPFHRFLQIYE